MEARDERRLRALQKHLNTVKLLIVDELGYVPFTAVGSEVFSQRYERGATLVTSNLPIRRMDIHIRFGTAHWRIARPPYPSCPHSGDEWGKLPPRHKQEGAAATSPGAWPKSKNTKRRRSCRQSVNQYKRTKITSGLQSPFS